MRACLAVRCGICLHRMSSASRALSWRFSSQAACLHTNLWQTSLDI